MKVTMEINQVLIEQGDLFFKYLETILQGMIFLNSFTLLQIDRLQLTAVVQNVCTKWLQGKVMMNCYSVTTS